MGYLELKRNALLVDSIWHVEAIAAYQFKGASARSKALSDLTGHGYNLKSSVASKKWKKATWSTANGFGFPATSYLENVDLNARTDIKTIIIRYSNVAIPTMLSMTSVNVTNPIIFLGVSPLDTYGFDSSNHILVVKSKTIKIGGYKPSGSEDKMIESYQQWTLNYLESKSAVQASGVVAYTTDGKIYFNGALQQTTSDTATVNTKYFGTQAATLIGTNTAQTGYIQAAAFYTKVLDASTITNFSEQMAAI